MVYNFVLYSIIISLFLLSSFIVCTQCYNSIYITIELFIFLINYFNFHPKILESTIYTAPTAPVILSHIYENLILYTPRASGLCSYTYIYGVTWVHYGGVFERIHGTLRENNVSSPHHRHHHIHSI